MCQSSASWEITQDPYDIDLVFLAEMLTCVPTPRTAPACCEFHMSLDAWLLFLKPGIDLVPTNSPMVICRELPGPGAIGYWELTGEGIEVGGSPEPRETFWFHPLIHFRLQPMDTSGALGELCLEGSVLFLSFLSVSPAHSLFFDLQEDGAGRQLPKETRLEDVSERGQQRLPRRISYPRPNVPTV